MATMAKSARKGKIFIDYFRNQRGATSVAASPPRGRAPGAPGLGAGHVGGARPRPVRESHFHAWALLERRLGQDSRRDPWAGYETAGAVAAS